VLLARLTALVALPIEDLDRDALQREAVTIGARFPAYAIPAA
jgi:hypothetical protein